MYNSIYPGYVNTYYPGVNNKQVKNKQDERNNSGSSKNAENNLQEKKQQTGQHSYFPNGEKVAIDYTKRQINIQQVLTDFQNTANAIGAPEDIKSEVSSYLSLIENQSQKQNPNQQIIQSNLKNASQILDEYITNTLNRPSKVVENWVDALFLQQIDYKMPKNDSNQNIESNTAKNENPILQNDTLSKNSNTVEEQAVLETKAEIYIPQDTQLKRMFIQSKKYAQINNTEKALSSFQNAMEYAEEIGDEQTCAMINYEQGRLYDTSDNIEEALYNYNQAATQSTNNDIKAKAHIYMGQIYDDFVNIEPAVNHYCAAVSYAGESDNLKLQSQALSNLARLHAEQYDKDNALMFMDLSNIAAEETGDDKVQGVTYYKNAGICEKLNENARALKLYGDSAYSYSQTEDNAALARDYQSAAEIMIRYGNNAKARKLLAKAYSAAQKTSNSSLKNEITNQIAML